MQENQFTGAMVEAAQCLWEAYIDKWLLNQKGALGEGSLCELFAFESNRGRVEVREGLREYSILAACCEGYELARAKGGFCDAFDWEFAPWFLVECLEVVAEQVALVPTWRDKCAKFSGGE